MNYFKTIPILLLTIIFLGVLCQYYLATPTILTPDNSNHLYETKLRQSLEGNHLTFRQLTIDSHQKQCQLEIVDPSTKHPTAVILSTSQDPYLQISVLQQLIKVAKIRHQVVTYLNLGVTHPYATLQDS